MRIIISWWFSLSGFKLRMKALPLASAATIYYKYFEEQSVTKYDPYVSTGM